MGKVHKSLTERLIFLNMLKDSSHTIFRAGKGGFELNLYKFDEAQFFLLGEKRFWLTERFCLTECGV